MSAIIAPATLARVLRTSLLTIALSTAFTATACGSDGETTSTSAAQGETVVAEQERADGDGATATQAQSGRLALQPVARFASPLTLTSPPGDTRRQFVVEQGGRIRIVSAGQVLPRPFLDVSRQIVSGGEQGLLGLAFPPDYQRSRRFYVTSPTGRATRGWSSTGRAARIPTSPTRRARASCCDRSSPSPTTTAASWPSARTGCSTWASATAAAATTATAVAATPRTAPRSSARSCASIRGLATGARTGSRLEPVRRASGATRRDLQLRAAQPVAVLVRPRDRRPDDRRRGPERGRGDRLRPAGPRPRRELRLAPWEGTKRIFPDEDAPGHVRPVARAAARTTATAR
jgi:hypothetical protein